MKVFGYGHSIIGGREMNQDAYLVDNNLKLYAVADGVGGGLRGEEASKMAVTGLQTNYLPGELLKPLVIKLADEVLKEALDSCNGQALMGTTLTAVQITDNLIHLCHVGDSRAYLFDGSALQQLSEDHEFFDEESGGAVLSSYLGLDTRVHALTVLEDTIEAKTGQALLLCSDGLYKQISEMQLVELLRNHLNEPEKLLEKMCHMASQVQYSDNITAVLVLFENP